MWPFLQMTSARPQLLAPPQTVTTRPRPARQTFIHVPLKPLDEPTRELPQRRRVIRNQRRQIHRPRQPLRLIG